MMGLQSFILLHDCSRNHVRAFLRPMMARRTGETDRHRALKQLAAAWARHRNYGVVAAEVRLPRSPYRADLAAAAGTEGGRETDTMIFECKASRADFLRDSAPEEGAKERMGEILAHLRTLRGLIAAHRPELRRGGELFAEYDELDLRGLRHPVYSRLEREWRNAQRKWTHGTKFARLARWCAADRCFLVAEKGVVKADEIPAGWGLLERDGDDLRLVRSATRLPIKPVWRETLVEHISRVAENEAVRRMGGLFVRYASRF